jgi:hypothetical protein
MGDLPLAKRTIKQVLQLLAQPHHHHSRLHVLFAKSWVVLGSKTMRTSPMLPCSIINKHWQGCDIPWEAIISMLPRQFTKLATCIQVIENLSMESLLPC